MAIAFDATRWHEFYALVGGGAAALLGLLFIALSLHLEDILQHPLSRGRAASALSELLSLFLLAILLLIPGQPIWLLGIELVVLGSAHLVWWIPSQVPTLSRFSISAGRLMVILLFDLSFILVVLCGVSLVVQRADGLYLLVPVVLFQVAHSVLNAGLTLMTTHAEEFAPRVR